MKKGFGLSAPLKAMKIINYELTMKIIISPSFNVQFLSLLNGL